MKPFICISCEGNDTKVVVVSKEKEEVKVETTFTIGITPEVTTSDTSFSGQGSDDLGMDDFSEDISFESLGSIEPSTGTSELSDINSLAAQLAPYNLVKSSFIPVLTEPSINYHIYEGEELKDKKKMLEAISADLSKSKNIAMATDNLDYIKLSERTFLCVYIDGEIPCVNLVDSLSRANGKKRAYKVGALKSAEVALANFVSKTTKFYPEDFSLIIYTGKDYSKLIFLEGQNLKHIGSTLDIGTQNLHTYDVYFSKILLEMENGSIPRLDNVILCGDDKSENLILSFYGTFPEANVTELKFDSIDLESLNDEEKENLSAYSIPLSAAVEYFDENGDTDGITLLPKFLKEKQKVFQFGWHSYAMFPILFLATFGSTYLIQSNNQKIKELDNEVNRLTKLTEENRLITDQINSLNVKISEFDKTQAILDSASLGTEVWGKMFENISDFIERRRNFWVNKLVSTNDNELTLTGYSLSRSSLTEFSDYNNSGILKNVLVEQLRERNAFSYSLSYKLFKDD